MKQRIKYLRISKAVKFFEERWKTKYDLVSLDSIQVNEPVFMVGLYNNKPDYEFIKKYKGPILLRWCGSDAKSLRKDKVDLIKSFKNIKHISISRFISKRLKYFGIDFIELPLTSTNINLNPAPLGDSVYFYGGSKHGEEFVGEIERRTGLNIIKTKLDTYSKEELLEIYERCFIGLRFTKFDGLSNTVLELGLMGRKCIYNGGLPHNIEWDGIDDICENIMKEYENREKTDYNKISQDFKKFLDIGDDWLKI